MTLLFFDGFDGQDHAYKWISNLAVAPSYAEASRYGIGTTLKAGSSTGRLTKVIPATAQIIVGFAFKVDNITAAHVMWSGYADSGAVQHTVLQTSTTGQVQALRAGTVLASSSAGLVVPGNWNYVEARMTIANSGGIFEVLVNGTQVINYTGDTQNSGTSTNFDLVALGGSTSIDSTVTYDDFYVLSTAASPNNTFLGECVVQTIVPNGAGASTGFTPIGAATNWEAVGDVPVDTADYVASNVVGTRDTYTLSDLSASTGSIYGVQTNMVASKTGVGAANVKAVVRSGGTNYYDSTVSLNASPQWSGTIRETNPATGAAWTSTAVNALEVGAEVA